MNCCARQDPRVPVVGGITGAPIAGSRGDGELYNLASPVKNRAKARCWLLETQNAATVIRDRFAPCADGTVLREVIYALLPSRDREGVVQGWGPRPPCRRNSRPGEAERETPALMSACIAALKASNNFVLGGGRVPEVDPAIAEMGRNKWSTRLRILAVPGVERNTGRQTACPGVWAE
jgi:hypothetical protein